MFHRSHLIFDVSLVAGKVRGKCEAKWQTDIKLITTFSSDV